MRRGWVPILPWLVTARSFVHFPLPLHISALCLSSFLFPGDSFSLFLSMYFASFLYLLCSFVLFIFPVSFTLPLFFSFSHCSFILSLFSHSLFKIQHSVFNSFYSYVLYYFPLLLFTYFTSFHSFLFLFDHSCSYFSPFSCCFLLLRTPCFSSLFFHLSFFPSLLPMHFLFIFSTCFFSILFFFLCSYRPVFLSLLLLLSVSCSFFTCFFHSLFFIFMYSPHFPSPFSSSYSYFTPFSLPSLPATCL